MTHSSVEIPSAALDGLMPMHLRLDSQGRIMHAAPTIEKLIGTCDGNLHSFFELFALRRPRGIQTMDALMGKAGLPLHLQLQGERAVQMKGIAYPENDGQGMVLNLSFGISIMEAVRRFELSGPDFAPTDLAIEMLYLVEAKSVAMEDTRRLNQRLQAARANAEERSRTDELTGVSNRRALEQVLSRAASRLKPFAIIHIDLDHFKKVNDTYGHAAGDVVLRRVSKILMESVRADDLVARVGGDEFVLVFQSETDPENLASISRRIIAKIEEPIPFGAVECRISASLGISVSSDYEQPDSDRMLLDADAATYLSKNAGRGQATMFNPSMASNQLVSG